MELLQGLCHTFFSRIISELAVKGKKKIIYGTGGVNSQIVQIYMDYTSLPLIRDITLEEIRFYYSPLIDGLIELQILKKDSTKGK